MSFEWNDQTRYAAWSWMAKVLADAAIIDEVAERPHQHPDVRAWYAKYTAQGGLPIVEHDNYEAFAKDFSGWFGGAYAGAQPVGNTFQCRVGMTRHYGPLSVEFMLEHTFAGLPGQAGHHAAVRYLSVAVKEMASEWERNNLKGVANGGHEMPPQNSASVSEVLEGTLEHNVENGKHRWRFRGGRWSKYGVPVYTEALKEAGLDDSEPVGELGEYRATIEYGGDGKPKRAVELVAIPVPF